MTDFGLAMLSFLKFSVMATELPAGNTASPIPTRARDTASPMAEPTAPHATVPSDQMPTAEVKTDRVPSRSTRYPPTSCVRE